MKKRRFYKKKKPLERVSLVGMVRDVFRRDHSVSRVVQGVRKPEQSRYQPPRYHGGNGTYRDGFPEHSREVVLKVDVPGFGVREIDVREEALTVNDRIRVTERFVHQLREKLLGAKIKVVTTRYESHVVDSDDLIL